MEDDVVIVQPASTAIGKFGGTLAKIPAAELGAQVIKALLRRRHRKPANVSEVIMGQVLTAGVGQNPARQAANQGRAAGQGSGHDHQQGVRHRTQSRDARCAGNQVRRRRHHHRRRPGKHERVAARAARDRATVSAWATRSWSTR